MARKKHVVHRKKKTAQKQKQKQRVSVNVKVIGGGGGGGGGGAGGGSAYPSAAPQFIPVEVPVYKSPVPASTPVANGFANPVAPEVPVKAPEVNPANAAAPAEKNKSRAGRKPGSKNKPKIYAEPVLEGLAADAKPFKGNETDSGMDTEAYVRKMRQAHFEFQQAHTPGFREPATHKTAELPRYDKSPSGFSKMPRSNDEFTSPIKLSHPIPYDEYMKSAPAPKAAAPDFIPPEAAPKKTIKVKKTRRNADEMKEARAMGLRDFNANLNRF